MSAGAGADDARAASAALRRLALDESLKARVAADSELRRLAWRVASRYVAGETVHDALQAVEAANSRSHRATVDYMGESCRDRDEAAAVTAVFCELPARMSAAGLDGGVSLDLSHIGSLIDPQLGLDHASRIAAAAAEAGQELILSAEGHDRTDLVLDTYVRLCERFANVGVTLQARHHRTPSDLRRLAPLPGRVRLVKGAYEVPESEALDRDDPALAGRFAELADDLFSRRAPCSIATHDRDLIERLTPHAPAAAEFEMLRGLDGGLLDELAGRGLPTREYIVFGQEWWLYVCNRIAEQPERLFAALADLTA
jgi:proline dehydrogenase